MNFDYIQPVKIIFGNYRIHELKNLIQQFEGDGLLICDRCFVEKEMHMRIDLKDFDIEEGQLKDLIAISHHTNLYNNPVEITDDILEDMYRHFIE